MTENSQDLYFEDGQNTNHIMNLCGIYGIICKFDDNFIQSWAEWGRLYFTLNNNTFTIRYQSKDTDSNNRKIAIGINNISLLKSTVGFGTTTKLYFKSINAVFDLNPTAFTGYFNPAVGTELTNCNLGTFGAFFNGGPTEN
jgi:hypothetical protein